MIFILVPSLVDLCRIRISATLWNHHHIKLSLQRLINSPKFSKSDEHTESYLAIEAEVIKGLPKLPLPKIVQQEFPRFIRGVGGQIVKWFKSHKHLYQDVAGCLDRLCWGPHGGIDNRATAERLMQVEELPVGLRFVFACLYCLEEHIYSLYPEICNKPLDQIGLRIEILTSRRLVSFWCDHMQGKSNYQQYVVEPCDNITFPECGFLIATYSGNLEAARHFAKLSPIENEKWLVRAFERLVVCPIMDYLDFNEGGYNDVLCYLLSAVSEEQQIQLLQSCWTQTLSRLIVWPWQNAFIQIVEHLRNNFTCQDYYRLFDIIITATMFSYKDESYGKLFVKYWMETTQECKAYFIEQAVDKGTVLKLFESDEPQLILLIIKEASVSQKDRLFFGYDESQSYICKTICIELVRKIKWDDLISIFLECTRGIEVTWQKIYELKRHLSSYRNEFPGCRGPHEVRLSQKWDDFFQLLDGLVELRQ